MSSPPSHAIRRWLMLGVGVVAVALILGLWDRGSRVARDDPAGEAADQVVAGHRPHSSPPELSGASSSVNEGKEVRKDAPDAPSEPPSLHGIVRNDEGKGLANARLLVEARNARGDRIWSLSEGGSLEATTDGKGRYQLDTSRFFKDNERLPEALNIRVHLVGWSRGTVSISVAGKRGAVQQDIIMSREAYHILGRVLDGAENVPDDVSLTLMRWPHGPTKRDSVIRIKKEHELQMDGVGRFCTNLKKSGQYAILVFREYRVVLLHPFEWRLEPEHSLDLGNLILPRTTGIEIRVFAGGTRVHAKSVLHVHEDDGPLIKAWRSLFVRRNEVWIPSALKADEKYEDSKRASLVHDLRPIPYRLEVDGAFMGAQASKRRVLKPPHPSAIDVHLDAAILKIKRPSPEGAHLWYSNRVSIWSKGEWREVEGRGDVEVAVPANSEVKIQAKWAPRRRAQAKHEYIVKTPARGMRLDWNIPLHAVGGGARVQVVDEAGAPMPRAHLWVVRMYETRGEDEDDHSYKLDEQGGAVVFSHAPQGNYRVFVHVHDDDCYYLDAYKDVKIRRGQMQDVSIPLKLGGRVKIRFERDSDLTTPSVDIRLVRRMDDEDAHPGRWSGPRRELLTRVLRPGTYDMVVRCNASKTVKRAVMVHKGKTTYMTIELAPETASESSNDR